MGGAGQTTRFPSDGCSQNSRNCVQIYIEYRSITSPCFYWKYWPFLKAHSSDCPHPIALGRLRFDRAGCRDAAAFADSCANATRRTGQKTRCCLVVHYPERRPSTIAGVIDLPPDTNDENARRRRSFSMRSACGQGQTPRPGLEIYGGLSWTGWPVLICRRSHFSYFSLGTPTGETSRLPWSTATGRKAFCCG